MRTPPANKPFELRRSTRPGETPWPSLLIECETYLPPPPPSPSSSPINPRARSLYRQHDTRLSVRAPSLTDNVSLPLCLYSARRVESRVIRGWWIVWLVLARPEPSDTAWHQPRAILICVIELRLDCWRVRWRKFHCMDISLFYFFFRYIVCLYVVQYANKFQFFVARNF